MACFCAGGSKKEVDLIREVEVLEEKVRSILADKDKAERRLNLEQLDRQRESNEAASALNHARVAQEAAERAAYNAEYLSEVLDANLKEALADLQNASDRAKSEHEECEVQRQECERMSVLLVETQSKLRGLERELKRQDSKEEGNSKSAQVALPPSPQRRKSVQYGVDIKWITKKNKMICAEFAHDSRAKDAGVRAGDILKAVDGTDILHMEVDEETCEHTAGDLLLGKKGSMCELLLLRVEGGCRWR